MSDSKLHPILSDMTQILSTLGNKDALQIFYATKRGIGSSTRTIRELDLSQKVYYKRLNQLLKAGLIEKTGKIYRHTMFGSACYRLGENFSKILSNRDQFSLLSRLENVDELSSAEKKKISQALSIDETLGLSNFVTPVILIDDYESLVRETVGLLEKAEGEVYFATQYFDARVVEELLRGIKRDVNFTFIYDFKGSLYERASLMMKVLFSSSKILNFFYEWLKSKNLRMRVLELPYTFLIVDDKYAMVELKSHEDAFSLAFIFESPIICRRLIKYFNVLWDRGSDFDLKKSLVDSLGNKDYENPSSNEKVKPEFFLKRNGEASKNH